MSSSVELGKLTRERICGLSHGDSVGGRVGGTKIIEDAVEAIVAIEVAGGNYLRGNGFNSNQLKKLDA